MSINVVIVDVSVTQTGSIEATAEVTAVGFDQTTYSLELRDLATDASEIFIDTIAPGAANRHTLTFNPGDETSGTINAVTEFDQDWAVWEMFGLDDLTISDCNIQPTTAEPGETISVDFTLSNDAPTNIEFEYIITVGGMEVENAVNTQFAGATNTFGATFTAQEGVEGQVEIEVIDVGVA